MIPRLISEKLLEWAAQYPIVTVTGPRQSGKTTLCRALFPDKPYLSLEDLSIRTQAQEDPKGFLARFPDGAVLDEIQRAPSIPSYLQTLVDADDRPGRFILTGSRQFELMECVSQSLAGRTAVARLLPFSYQELYADGDETVTLDDILYSGFFPRIHDKKLDPTEALSFYVATYLERDIRQILNVRDLSKFEIFLRLLAGRTAQVFNANSLACDCGLSNGTINAWIGALEQSSILYRLKPYFTNIGKRLIKAPKLYFLDSGLLCYLLNIFNPGQLAVHPLRGQIFESFVVAELLKSRFNHGLPDLYYYYRDSKGTEVDILAEEGNETSLWEIKSSATFHPDFLSSLNVVARLLPNSVHKHVVLGASNAPHFFKDADIVGYPYITNCS